MGIDRTGPIGQYRFVSASNDRVKNAGRRESAPAGGPEDSINLSSAARDLAAAPPEERAEIVQRIRHQVEAGAYRVDPDAIARQMIERGEV